MLVGAGFGDGIDIDVIEHRIGDFQMPFQHAVAGILQRYAEPVRLAGVAEIEVVVVFPARALAGSANAACNDRSASTAA